MLWVLSDQERSQLEIFCQKKESLAGEVLFREWEEATAMYIVGWWKIEISKNTSWEKKVLAIIGRNEMLGEMALFWDTWKRMATATVIEQASFITILSFSIKELMRQNPELSEKVKEIIEQRIYANKSLNG